MKISVHLNRESRGAHRAAMIWLPVKSKKTKPTTSDTHFRHEGRDSLVNACLWLTYCWIIFVIRFGSKFVVMTMFRMWSLDVRNFESCFRFTAAIFLCAMRGTKGQLRLACATPKRPIGVPLSSRGHHQLESSARIGLAKGRSVAKTPLTIKTRRKQDVYFPNWVRGLWSIAYPVFLIVAKQATDIGPSTRQIFNQVANGE